MYFIVIPYTHTGIYANYIPLKSGINNYLFDLMIFNSDDISKKYIDCITNGNYYIRVVINLNPKSIISNSHNLSYYIERNTNFILSDQISSKNIKSIITFNLPITVKYINEICKSICKFNYCKILDYLHNNNKIEKFWIPSVIYQACSRGNVNILEWLKNVNLLCHDTSFLNNNIIHYIEVASALGNLNILDWWFKNNLPFEYSESVLDSASANGDINVINWWVNSNLPLKYSKNALDYASKNGHVDVLDWWVNSNLPLKYSDNAFNLAYENGNIDILDWWINSNLPLKYNDYILIASINLLKLKLLKSLEWFKKSGLTLTINKFTVKFILNNEPEYIGILMNYFTFPLQYRLRYYYYKLKLHSN